MDAPKANGHRSLTGGRPFGLSVSLLLLLLSSVAFFWALYLVDAWRSVGLRAAFVDYLNYDPQSITDAISALAGVVVAVLGIVITVVSIVVQLSAARFTGITRMFLRDRVNLLVIGYYVVICVVGIWLSVSLKHDYVPRFALTSMLLFTSLAVVLMVPYFGYVFAFLEPMNIIRRIFGEAFEIAKQGAVQDQVVPLQAAQARVLLAMEELTDIASSSISGKDKIIASGAVDALKDLALAYVPYKNSASEGWYRIGAGLSNNPDFVAMDPESLSDLEARRTWVEWKVMRQYLGIYNEALVGMRDINYLIAIDTRYIGEAAVQARDDELVRLVYRFMNSYLRATLNARDVRTAYNVLNQYRLLVESMIRSAYGPGVLEGLEHMIYYGHMSFDMKLTFVTETVAYDVSALCQQAHASGLAEERAMLERFLELDRPLRAQIQESALIGVRKAQVKLASYYLSKGDEARARRIYEDMRHEPRARLESIFEALAKVTTKDFWEIIDRGRNFEYMPEAQRAELSTFVDWFGGASSSFET